MTYNTCTRVDRDVEWCATKVNEDGIMLENFWGECDRANCTNRGKVNAAYCDAILKSHEFLMFITKHASFRYRRTPGDGA